MGDLYTKRKLISYAFQKCITTLSHNKHMQHKIQCKRRGWRFVKKCLKIFALKGLESLESILFIIVVCKLQKPRKLINQLHDWLQILVVGRL